MNYSLNPGSSRGNTLIPTGPSFIDSVDSTELTVAGQTVMRPNCMATLPMTTGPGCRELRLFIANNVVGLQTLDMSLAAYIDGVYSKQVTPTVINAVQVLIIPIPVDGVSHAVDIVYPWIQYGTQSSFVWRVSSIGGEVQLRPSVTPSSRVVVYGDSITNGARATRTVEDSWLMRVRRGYAGRISAEAWGGRNRISQDIPALIARISALFSGASTRTFWDAIAYNDFSNGAKTPTEVGALARSLYEGLHAADPTVQIYSQTALITGDEAAENALGFTIAEYRAGKVAACEGLAYVVPVVGTDLMTSDGLSADGVHPSTDGHATIGDNILAMLNGT